MAASVRCLRSVLHGCQRHVLKQANIINPSSTITNRSWAAVRFYAAETAAVKKYLLKKKTSKEPVTKQSTKDQLAEKREDKDHLKLDRRAHLKPNDDVYLIRYYAKPILEPETAIEMLKTFQRLDFTDPEQSVYVELKLDMKLEKKKKLDAFVGYLNLPFPFVKELNKILVFTEKAEEAEAARLNGAAFVGGIELIPQILNDEIQADFYIATPEIIDKLIIIKNKLRKKFPKSKRGSVGDDVINMIKLFETGYEYIVEDECLVKTKIATLDMPVEHIAANLSALVEDVCKHKPLSFGPFVESALLNSATSEVLCINCQKFFPQVVENIEE